jgi:hypothetical protein
VAEEVGGAMHGEDLICMIDLAVVLINGHRRGFSI